VVAETAAEIMAVHLTLLVELQIPVVAVVVAKAATVLQVMAAQE
jgi:hypothetical protein